MNSRLTNHPLPANRRYLPQCGFSLVEMAIVLVIVGLALGAGLSVLSAQVEQKKINDTQKALEEAKDALMGFAIVNGRLPRPATVASNGVEIAAAACGNDLACTGLIPWTTLGVTKLDAWAKVIRYSVTPVFATAAFEQDSVATKNVQTRVNGGPLVALANAVPAVVFSHGRDNFGTTDGGVVLPNLAGPNNIDEISNNTGNATGTTFVQRSPSTNPAAPGVFDDMVVWLPTATLLSRLGAAGRTVPP